jgi:hypothetical protein
MKQNPRVRNSFMDPSLLVEIKEAKKFRDLFYHRRESENIYISRK